MRPRFMLFGVATIDELFQNDDECVRRIIIISGSSTRCGGTVPNAPWCAPPSAPWCFVPCVNVAPYYLGSNGNDDDYTHLSVPQ